MTYQQVLEAAKKNMSPKCRVCPECNGIACKGDLPGVGGYGNGRGFTICREYLKLIKLNMDTLYSPADILTETEFLRKKISMPLAVSPIGGMAFNYNGYLTDEQYNQYILSGCRDENILCFSGDTPDDRFFNSLLPLIQESEGRMISTIKPWKNEIVLAKMQALKEMGAEVAAMDIDSACLPALNLKGGGIPKSVEDLRMLIEKTGMQLILKGIMTADAAVKAREAGVSAIIVSTHGGRHYEDAPATAEVLPEIRAAVGEDYPVWVDGGIRSGSDIFKVIALGASGAMIGRPYAIAAHGGAVEGVKLYTEKLRSELIYAMQLTNCSTIKDIRRNKIRIQTY